ncbi:MAG: methyltransferase [Solirubrobacteraceae bacterium]|nr:methyltransferase [Solirubrobacteraceae bacterium]
MIWSRFGPLKIFAPPGVYAPRSDTALLASQLGELRGLAVLELCAGSGAVALTAARAGAASVVAIDRSLRAVLTIKTNAVLNDLRIDARRGDLFAALAPGERFDVVIANPPYLPCAADNDDRWDAGRDGRAVLDRLADDVGPHLRPGGRLVVIQSGFAGVEATLRRLFRSGLTVTQRTDSRGPLGPIARARHDYLLACGALPGDAGGEEVLTVLTARRSTDEGRALTPCHSFDGGSDAAATARR